MTVLTRNRIAVTVLAAAVAAFWLTRPSAPALDSVDGIYANGCCAPVRLDNGVLIAGSQRVPFRLVQMKFGLVAYPARALAVRDGHRVVVREMAEPPGIVFDTRHRILSLSSEAGTGVYLFVRR